MKELRRLCTAEDDRELRKLADEISPQRIAVRMKRSVSAIHSRAIYLQIRFRHRAVLRKSAVEASKQIPSGMISSRLRR